MYELVTVTSALFRLLQLRLLTLHFPLCLRTNCLLHTILGKKYIRILSNSFFHNGGKFRARSLRPINWADENTRDACLKFLFILKCTSQEGIKQPSELVLNLICSRSQILQIPELLNQVTALTSQLPIQSEKGFPVCESQHQI